MRNNRRDISSSTWRAVAVLALVAAVMLAVTWLGWPDPIVDFGRELYVPWQITQGKVLYRDLAYFNGPLSPCFNAVIFKILGVSMHALMVVNTLIAIAVIAMLWKLFRIAGGVFSATVACLSFELLFMTTQFVDNGNYNWICPYSHELTHGLALGFAAMVAMMRFIAHPRKRNAAIVGFCLGLSLLTKPEIAVAVGGAIAVGMILAVRGRHIRGKKLVAAVATFVIAMVLPAIASVALLSSAMPISQAFRSTTGGWAYAFDARFTSLKFYKDHSGINAPAANAIRALTQAGIYLLLLAPAALTDWVLAKFNRTRRTRLVVAISYVSALLGLQYFFGDRIAWPDAFYGLSPAIALTMLALLVFVAKRRFLLPPRAIARVSLAVLATLLLLKVMLAVQIVHYGFALAMPAFLVLCAVGISWLRLTPLTVLGARLGGGRNSLADDARCHNKMAPLPVCPRGQGEAWVLRFAMTTALAIVSFKYLQAYGRFYLAKPTVVADGSADAFRAQARGLVVNEVLSVLDQLPRESTIAAIPQGVMLNYLSRRMNPTPFTSLLPLEMLMNGDAAVAKSYADYPPDVLLIVPTDLHDEGYESLGEYAPACDRFFHENYILVQTFGAPRAPSIQMYCRKRN